MSTLSAQQRAQRIIAAVRAVPRGEVRSYAAIAREAGLPRGARQVVAVLKTTEVELPWHRVIRADGRIAFPVDSAQFVEQQRLLRAEGLIVREGRVAAMNAGPPAESVGDLDSLLWAPAGSSARRR